MTPTTATPTKAANLGELGREIEALVDHIEDKMWANVPAVQEAVAAAETARRTLPQLQHLVEALPSVHGVVRAAYATLAAGGGVDEDTFRTDLAAASAASEARQAVATVAGSPEDSRRVIHAAKVTHQDAALAFLDRTLRQLVALAQKAIAIQEKAGAADFDYPDRTDYAAIAESAAVIRRAVDAHTNLRRLQLAITSSPSVLNMGPLIAVYGMVRHLPTDTAARSAHAFEVAAARGWLEPDVPNFLEDPEGALRFVCRQDLEPCVPTAGEVLSAKSKYLAQAKARRQAEENPTRAGRTGVNDPRVRVTGDKATQAERAHNARVAVHAAAALAGRDAYTD